MSLHTWHCQGPCKPHSSAGTLPWLESNDALALATRMETRLPWRPTRGSLTSPSYLVRKRTLGPPLLVKSTCDAADC